MEPSASASPAPAPDQAWAALRPMEAGDRDFIESTWRRNYERVGRWTGCPGGLQQYIETQAAVIETCLRTSEVLVAYPPENPPQILGWCCFRRPSTVHYVYVKPYYRGAGIGRSLLHAAVGDATHIFHTHRWQQLPRDEAAAKACAGINHIVDAVEVEGKTVITYNPALIFGPQRQEWMPR